MDNVALAKNCLTRAVHRTPRPGKHTKNRLSAKKKNRLVPRGCFRCERRSARVAHSLPAASIAVEAENSASSVTSVSSGSVTARHCHWQEKSGDYFAKRDGTDSISDLPLILIDLVRGPFSPPADRRRVHSSRTFGVQPCPKKASFAAGRSTARSAVNRRRASFAIKGCLSGTREARVAPE